MFSAAKKPPIDRRSVLNGRGQIDLSGAHRVQKSENLARGALLCPSHRRLWAERLLRREAAKNADRVFQADFRLGVCATRPGESSRRAMWSVCAFVVFRRNLSREAVLTRMSSATCNGI